MNTPLEPFNSQEGYSLRHSRGRSPTSKVSVVLYFSGGGTRAAALSYGVMQELARTPADGVRLLDRVVAINAVSGGSFTAAYYCLYGDRLFRDFETAFLKRDVQGALVRRVLSPANRWRLWSDWFASSDLAAEYYDRTLFHGATFGDLLHNRERRPLLVVNATDMDTFSHFSFTQDAFDLIGSDLTTYPLSRAVAASSAVPVVLSPITLKNYATERPPLELAAPAAGAAELGSRQDAFARLARSRSTIGKRPYIHLLDGGLADNLGLSNLLVGLALTGGWDGLLQHGVPDHTGHVVLIVVNAATESDGGWSRDDRTPGVRSVVSALSKSSISRTNELLLELVKESLEEWNHRPAVVAGRPRLHLIAVDFTQLADPKERSYFSHIPTRLQLPPETVDRLVTVGGRILRESPEFRTLLMELQCAPAVPAPADR